MMLSNISALVGGAFTCLGVTAPYDQVRHGEPGKALTLEMLKVRIFADSDIE